MSRVMKDSGVEWIGEIPEGWSTIRFKFLHEGLNTGESIDKEYWTTEETHTVFYTAGLEPISTSFRYFPVEKLTNENDLLLARNGTPYVYYPVKGACYTDHIIRVAMKDGINRKFVKYALQQGIVSVVVNSVSIATWSASIWNEQLITYPPISEQSQIVSFLDHKCTAIDTAIEKTRKSIEKLEEYKKAVITKAVTKGIDPNAKMKDSGVEWIGEIPENWDVKKLRQFYSRRLNKNIDLQENNLLSLSYGNIIRKNIETKEGLLPKSFDGYNIVEYGDIVIRGTDLQNDHRSLRTGLVTERGIITSAYITLKPNNNVNSEYYRYLLHCYDLAKVFYSMGGGLRQGLDYWEFIRLFVLVPSEEEQSKIVNYIKNKCDTIDIAIEKKKVVIKKWEEYKKSLIYYAVTGKIDCRNEVG